MKRIVSGLLITILLLAISGPALAESGDTSALQSTIEQYVHENADTTAAMSLSVFTAGEVLLEQSFGHINIADGIPNTLDDVFEWGSVTKLLLPVSAMQLVEQGLLDLNANINTYLPEGFLTKLAYNDPITIIHLLSHTAGFQEAIIELFVPSSRPIRSLEDAVRSLQPAQVFRPGEVTSYSNFGSALAGYIIERISGQSYHSYVHENIFAPLGMTQTALLPGLSDNPWVKAQRERVECYTPGLQHMGVADFAITWYPAGMATGTIADFRKFGQALLPDANGSSPLFQHPESLSNVYTPTSYYPDGVTGNNYHGFWAELHLAGKVIGHGGNTAGMSAMLHIDIENSLGTVIMTNQAGEQVYNRRMSTLIFGWSDFSQFDNSVNDVRVNTAFRSARTFQKGMFRIHAMMGSTMPMFQRSSDVLSVPLFTDFDRVAPGVYLAAENDMMSNIVMFISSDEAGNADGYTMMTSDYLRVSWGLIAFEVVILLMLLISGIYGIVVLIRLLVNKIRKKEQSYTVIRACIAAVFVLIMVHLAFFAISAFSLALTLSSMPIHGMIQILLPLTLIICTTLLLLKLKTPDLSKKQKRQIITPAIMCAFFMINTIYWQFWVFWV